MFSIYLRLQPYAIKVLHLPILHKYRDGRTYASIAGPPLPLPKIRGHALANTHGREV